MPKRSPKTITLFDGPTEGHSNGQALEAVPYVSGSTQAVQARSLLIESLVEQLCTFIEPDPQRQKKLFCYICQKLTNLKFLVPGLPQDDALPIRKKFKDLTKNFIKLSIRNCDLQNNTALVPRDAKSSTLLSPDLCDDFTGLLSSEIIFQSSRYMADFSDEQLIASGGFGVVCKAWKKVDQQYYAVKKIPFKYMQDPLLNKVLREVEFLAQNSHPNVVAYKTAWIEPSTENDPVLESRSDSSSDTDTSDNLPSGVKYARTEEDSSSTLDETNDYIVFTENTETSYRRETVRDSCKISVYCEDTVQTSQILSKNIKHGHSASSDVSKKETSSESRIEVLGTKKCSSDPSKKELVKPTYKCGSSSSGMSLVPGSGCKKSFKDKLCKGVLYVQMELCRESLRHWLDRRLDSRTGVDVPEAMAILKQVIKGTEYLHSKGIIHRDLKPQNILFSDNCVKIGDFGLATFCCQNGTGTENDSGFYGWIGHTQGVGTSPYAAPEQRKGNQYGFKADMYSIGVIWLELLYSFRTSMELSKCLEDAHGRKCNLPKQLLRDQPEAAKMIDVLTQGNPECRPSASDVLNSEMFLSKAQIIENLKQQLAHKDGVIKSQEKLLQAKDQEISLLQSTLKQINYVL